MIIIDESTKPRAFLHTSREYLQAYTVLKENDPKPTELYLVKFYLLCHSVELSLKAYLRLRGHEIKELRSREVGHDLFEMLKICNVQHNFVLSPGYTEVIKVVSTYYKSKEYEYFPQGDQLLIDIDILEEIAILLVKIIGARIFEEAKTG